MEAVLMVSVDTSPDLRLLICYTLRTRTKGSELVLLGPVPFFISVRHTRKHARTHP